MDQDGQRIQSNAEGHLFLVDNSGNTMRLYRFREALDHAKVSAASYYTWIKQGLLPDTRLRNRGKWRVFTEPELKRLIAVAEEEQCRMASLLTCEKQLRESRDSEWRK